jgi:tetratricopeptide (TPR) repeat protein
LGSEHASAEANAIESSKFPNLSEDEARRIILETSHQCAFHSAIIEYNVGAYKSAIEKFKLASGINKDDLLSSVYVPEGKYLGQLARVPEIEAEFGAIIEEVKARPTSANWPDGRKKSFLAQCYVRWGNIHFGKNLTKCKELYEQAYELDRNYLSCFSLAQLRRAELGESPEAEELFGEAFRYIQVKVSTTIEGRILLMLYYMLAICCKEGNIRGEIPQTYLALIFREVSSLNQGSETRIFSPTKKNDCTLDEFISEVRLFQESA